MDGILSQDELNALLSGGDPSDDDIDLNDALTKEEKDAIGEIGNISMGASSTALSTLLGQDVNITTPVVTVGRFEDFIEEVTPEEQVLIQIEYSTGVKGLNIILMKQKDVEIIADIMMGNTGENPPPLDDMALSAAGEAMNQMMGSSSTALASMISKDVDIMPPQLSVANKSQINDYTDFFEQNDHFVIVRFNMTVGSVIKTKLAQIMNIEFAKELISDMINDMNKEPEPKVEEKIAPAQEPVQQEPMYEQPKAAAPNMNQGMDMGMGAGMAAQPQMDPMMMQQMMAQMMGQMNMGAGGMTNVQPAQFTNFGTQAVKSIHSNIDMIMDVPLQVTVELGRTKMLIKEILDLGQGSIVELDKLAGEPVDILVNSKLIAKGEVVVIDESFGVRITDIVSKMEIINKVQ